MAPPNPGSGRLLVAELGSQMPLALLAELTDLLADRVALRSLLLDEGDRLFPAHPLQILGEVLNIEQAPGELRPSRGVHEIPGGVRVSELLLVTIRLPNAPNLAAFAS
jgi:hypothetical protein